MGDFVGTSNLIVRILVLFYTVNFTTYSSKVDYTMLTLVPRLLSVLL